MVDECPKTTKEPTFLQGVFSEPDGTPSSRRILFATAVAFALGLVTAAFYVKQTLSIEMVDIIKTCLYATAGALGIGKFAESAK